jgi:hypothetical protein
MQQKEVLGSITELYNRQLPSSSGFSTMANPGRLVAISKSLIFAIQKYVKMTMRSPTSK